MSSRRIPKASSCGIRPATEGRSGGRPRRHEQREVPSASPSVHSRSARICDDLGGTEMPTYLMLTNLTAEGVRTLKNNPGRVAEVNKEVEQIGAKVVAQYATLGQYDFVTVVEAPDEKTMAKVSVELGLARDDEQPDADRDAGRRPGRGALARPLKVLVVGGGGREHAIVRALRPLGPRARAALRARQRRHRRRRRVPGGGGRRRRRGDRRRGERAPGRPGRRSGPRRRWSPALSTPWRGRGLPAFGPSARGGRAGGLEGLRQGADAGGRGADRRPRAAAQPRAGGRGAGPGQPTRRC